MLTLNVIQICSGITRGDLNIYIVNTKLIFVPALLDMEAFIKGEPGYEDEETIIGRITIKNEPGTSVGPCNKVTEHEHIVNPGSCSCTAGPTFEIDHPAINQTSTRVKD